MARQFVDAKIVEPALHLVKAGSLEVDASAAELARRRAQWQAPPPKFTKGVLYKYMKVVSSASEGCVTDA